jgi:hypothetical protein
LVKQVTELLVQRIANGFPAPLPRAVSAIAIVDKNIRALQDDLRQIKQAGGDGKDLRSFLKRYPPAIEVPKAPSRQRDEESADADIKTEDFADKSYEDLKASRELVQKQAEESSPKDEGLEARKNLTLELFKSLRDGLKSVLLESYIKELPIVGALHDILSSALDKSAKDYIDRKADAVAASMPKGRNALDTALSEIAREVSASIKVEVTPRLVARCRRSLADCNAEVRMVNTLTLKAPKEIQLAQARPAGETIHNAARLDRLPPRPKSAPVEDDGERRTMRKRLRRSLTAVGAWCRENRHALVGEQQKTLNAKLRAIISITGDPRTPRVSGGSIGAPANSGTSGSIAERAGRG